MMKPGNEMIIRPAGIYALLRIAPLLPAVLAFLLLAWCIAPVFMVVSVLVCLAASCKFMRIRSRRFAIGPEFIRMYSGVLFKRTSQVEMFSIKDYIITRSPVHQLFGLMNLVIKTTDPENPVIQLDGIPQSELVDIIRGHVKQARLINKIIGIS